MKGLRSVKVNLEFVDIGRDICASYLCRQHGLLHGKERCGERCYALLFELFAREQTLPCARDLDADTRAKQAGLKTGKYC